MDKRAPAAELVKNLSKTLTLGGQNKSPQLRSMLIPAGENIRLKAFYRSKGRIGVTSDARGYNHHYVCLSPHLVE